MTGEKFKIQHLGALVAGESQASCWTESATEWPVMRGYLFAGRAAMRESFWTQTGSQVRIVRLKQTRSIFRIPESFTRRGLEGRYHRESIYPRAREQGSGEYIDEILTDRENGHSLYTQTHPWSLPRPPAVTGSHLSLSFGVQRGFYDPSGVHLDTTLPRPPKSCSQPDANIDESAGGRRACLGTGTVSHIPIPSHTYLSASTSMSTATAAATAAHPPRLAQLTEQLTCLFEAIDHSVRPTTRRRGCRQLWPPAVTRVRAGHAREDDGASTSTEGPPLPYPRSYAILYSSKPRLMHNDRSDGLPLRYSMVDHLSTAICTSFSTLPPFPGETIAIASVLAHHSRAPPATSAWSSSPLPPSSGSRVRRACTPPLLFVPSEDMRGWAAPHSFDFIVRALDLGLSTPSPLHLIPNCQVTDTNEKTGALLSQNDLHSIHNVELTDAPARNRLLRRRLWVPIGGALPFLARRGGVLLVNRTMVAASSTTTGRVGFDGAFAARNVGVAGKRIDGVHGIGMYRARTQVSHLQFGTCSWFGSSVSWGEAMGGAVRHNVCRFIHGVSELMISELIRDACNCVEAVLGAGSEGVDNSVVHKAGPEALGGCDKNVGQFCVDGRIRQIAQETMISAEQTYMMRGQTECTESKRLGANETGDKFKSNVVANGSRDHQMQPGPRGLRPSMGNLRRRQHGVIERKSTPPGFSAKPLMPPTPPKKLLRRARCAGFQLGPRRFSPRIHVDSPATPGELAAADGPGLATAVDAASGSLLFPEHRNSETESFSGLIVYCKVEDFHPDERGIAAGERPNPVPGDVSVPRAGSNDGHVPGQWRTDHAVVALEEHLGGSVGLAARKSGTSGGCKAVGMSWTAAVYARRRGRASASVMSDNGLAAASGGPLRIPGSEVVSHRAGAGGNQTYEKPMEVRGRDSYSPEGAVDNKIRRCREEEEGKLARTPGHVQLAHE
ncbi:hypothetical protein C8R46DRAFT_1042102 [Mycena filopes]|nr:hypothetical protein C8R46DRAFT_1042102 [Mycena filopes]